MPQARQVALLLGLALATSLAQEAPWTGKLSDFSQGVQGWDGTETTSGCGRFGVILGGHNALGSGQSVMKKFTGLPSHNAVRVQLRYMFMRTWDQEYGLVFVDDVEKWRYQYWGRNPTSTECGVNTHFEDADIVIGGHTADSITIRVTSTIDQNSGDESFGITDVIVTPFTTSGGEGKGPVTSGTVIDFGTDAGLKPWLGEDVTQESCNPKTMLTSSGGGGPEAFMQATFTGLADHNAVKVSLKYAFLQSAGKMKAQVHVAGRVAWEQSSFALGKRDGCGDPIHYETVQAFILNHDSDELVLDVLGLLIEGTFFGVAEAKFGIIDVVVEVITLGEGPWSVDKSDFSKGPDGWLGPAPPKGITGLVRTYCQAPYGHILGGQLTGQKKTTSTKSFTDIPKHSGVVISMTFLYLNWGNQAIKGVVDYDAVASAWEGDYNQAVATDGQECGTRTRSAPVRIFIPDHTADKISLSVHTTESQWSGEEFGFTDVSINPLSLAVAPTGDWREGAAKFDAANQDGWGGTSLRPAFCKNLAGDSLWVGADKNAVGAVVAKIFTKLPAHQALRVTMKYTFTQASGSQTAFVVADSHLVWQDKQSTASKQCSSADTITVEVDEVVLHEEDTVNIQVWGEVDGGGGSFKMSDVMVEPIVLGEGRWTPDKSDFSKWSDGWDGTNLGTTFCANLGATILGGHNQLGGQDEVHKKYTGLPPHTAVRITMNYVFMHTWDHEFGQVKIDGEVRWQQSHVGSVSTVSGCGVVTHQAEVSILVKHTADDITVQATSTLNQGANDESFGIYNVVVDPIILTGTGSATWSNGQIDFSKTEDFAAFAGSNLQTFKCPGSIGTLLSSRSGSNSNPTAFVQATWLNLPSHNALHIKGSFVFMHTSNVMKGELVVDGALLWSAEKAGTGIVNDCGSQANTVDFLAYVSHKDGSLTLDFSGTMASVGAGQGAFGILSLVVTPMTIGREKYSRESAISDFSAGPDGFLAPANFQRTTCDSPLGTILGGDKTDSPGVVVEKTWTDLPAHKMILVAFTYVYLGGWDAARIGTCKADDAVVWSSKRADAFGPTSTACAGMATKTTRGTALLSHDADELTLTFGSTGNVHNQEEFGIYDVEIIPAQLSSGGAKWLEDVNTFKQGPLGWVGLTARVIPCLGSELVNVFSSRSGTRTTIAFQTFTELPAGTTMARIEMDVVFLQDRGAQEVSVYINDARVWSGTQNAVSGVQCGSRPRMRVSGYGRVGTNLEAAVFVWGAAEGGASLAIDNVKVTPLKLGEGDWDGKQSDFSEWTDGWAGSSLSRTSCGALGTILGGHGVLGTRAFVSKKFTNLPSHTSVRIEMRFYYIRTWDDESALVYVDNILRWRNSHSHRRQTNNACSGQEGHFVDLDIVINSHTASEITLRVTSTLDQNAGDEAFGIQNVIVSPYTLDVGKGIGPLPEGGSINFDEAAGIAPWGGIGLEVKTCQGASGLVVTGNGGDDPSSFAAAHFTDISEHNAIRMTGTFVFLNPEASQKAQLFIDSEQLWEMSSDKGDADCSGQGVPFEVYTAHTSKEAKIDFSGDRVGKSSFKPSFALRNLKVELQILGSSPWAKGVSDFSKGMDGWLGAGNLQRTTCDDPIGVILGGTDTQPKGSVTSKTYTDLPKHTSLIVRFTVVYMSWEGDYPAQLVVDGDNLWSLPYSKVLNRGTWCGETTGYVTSTIIVPGHTANEVKLEFSTGGNQYRNQRFGISQVEIAPVDTGADGGTGPWTKGPSVFADHEGWAASNRKIVDCQGSKALVATGPVGFAAIAFKKYLDIPPHGALRVNMDVYSYSTGSENVQVDVTADGQLVLSKMLSPFGESCNADNLWKAEFYLGTSTEQVNLQVLAERAQSSQNPAAVALANVEMVPLTLGSLAWEERTSDFSQWSDGWALSKYGFTVCKQGVVLGGHNVLGTGGWVQKQFTDLPKHNALRIELTYVFFRTWDHEEGIILVDGVTRWSLSHQGGTNAVTDDCEGLQTRREGVTILVSGHVEDTVTIRATSTLEQGAADEAFGIRDVRVVPFTLSGGTGNGPWINDETVDFRDDASLKPWVGSHLDTTACSFMLVAASGSPDEDEAVVTAGYTQLPEHNAVEVKFKFVFLHPAGKMKGFVSIDSNAVWSEERASGDRDACPPTEAMYAEFSQIIQHSGSSLKIDAKAIRTEGTSEPSFAMYAVSVKPITLGVGKWQKGKSDFTTSTDGWFGPGLQQRTTCNAPISTTILGGDRTNKQIDQAYKVFTELPEHAGLAVRLKFHFIKWNNPEYMGEILIDNQRVWARAYGDIDKDSISEACGYTVGTEDTFFYMPGHTLESLKISVRTTGSVHSHMHFGISDVEVILYDKCADGEYEAVPPTRTGDRECKTVTVCKDTQFEFSPPNDIRDRGCRDCSLCPAGFTTESACSARSDTVCKRCDSCEDGFYAQEKCTDTTATKCAACTKCGEDFFQVSACTGGEDAVCKVCSTTCPVGQFIDVPCTSVSDRTCKDATKCVENEEFEIQKPTATTDRFCRALSPSCSFDEWENKAPTATSDRVCVPATGECNRDESLGPKEFELVPLTTTSDRVCRRCTVCPTSHKEISSCKKTKDAVCQECPVCSSLQFAPEVCAACEDCKVCSSEEYEVRACDLDNKDRQCEPCRACELGKSYEVSPCIGTNNRVCTQATQCSPKEYQSRPPTLISDRECTPLRICDTDEFETEAPTATSDRVCKKITLCKTTEFIQRPKSETSDQVCKTCSECPQGQFAATPCSRNRDTVCEPCRTCPGGSFSTECDARSGEPVCVPCDQDCLPGYTRDTVCRAHANMQCKPCNTCKANEYQTQECSTSFNRVCQKVRDACKSSQYESRAPTTTSNRKCTSVRNPCRGSSYESRAPTTTSNRVCTPWTVCPKGWQEVRKPTNDFDRVCEGILNIVFKNADFESIFGDPARARDFRDSLLTRLSSIDRSFLNKDVTFHKGSVIASVTVRSEATKDQILFSLLSGSFTVREGINEYRGEQLTSPIPVPTTSTTTAAGSGSTVNPDASGQQGVPTDPSGNGGGSNIGVIVGVVVGVLVVLVVIVVAVLFVRRSDSPARKDSSHISFENPMYDTLDHQNSDPTYNPSEGAYDDVPAATPGYMQPGRDDFAAGYTDPEDAGIRGQHEAGYMDTSALRVHDNDVGYMETEGVGDESGYMEVKGVEVAGEDI